MHSHVNQLSALTGEENSAPFEVITLGTAAGPAIRSAELGIATAIVVEGSWYLVDFGLGSTRAAKNAGLHGSALRATFVTHMHSDHVVEVPAFFLWNWGLAVDGITSTVPILGPGDCENTSGLLTGTSKMIEHTLEAFGADIRIRQEDEARPPLRDLIEARELAPDLTTPTVVYEDEKVKVSAVLVDHPPVSLAYAYRFDTAYGSVTLSGDTTECEALVELAQDTDVLVHEAVNLDFFQSQDFSAEFIRHQEQSHTVPSAAGRVASRSGAKSLILSHLAGPATEDYWLTEAASTFDGPIAVAKSGQRFTTPHTTAVTTPNAVSVQAR